MHADHYTNLIKNALPTSRHSKLGIKTNIIEFFVVKVFIEPVEKLTGKR